MKHAVLIVFLLLSVSFLSYSVYLYCMPDSIALPMENNAVKGKMVWQKYNCQSCHQFYGLGGYLGPDLSNIYSRLKKNEIAIAAVIRSGNAFMPAYSIEDDEMKNLLAFFKRMDLSGKADPRTFYKQKNGMINQ